MVGSVAAGATASAAASGCPEGDRPACPPGVPAQGEPDRDHQGEYAQALRHETILRYSPNCGEGSFPELRRRDLA